MADIVLRNVSKNYGERPVLSALSAVFPEGKISSIRGPSGCGKTTLLRILLGLETLDSGEIAGLPAGRSAVFQEHRLFEDFSAVSNVCAVLSGRERALVISALTALGLGESLFLPVRSLSGGMKRRVSIVRALLAPGELLVLDEPFTGLDAESKARSIALLREYRRGRTTLLVTHDSFELEQLAEYRLELPLLLDDGRQP